MALIKKFRIKAFKNKLPVARLEKISLSFAKRQILDNISFSMNSGEIIGLLGPNGAGKSTVFNDFMEAKLSENIAIISGNIFYKNYSSEIFADKIEFNLLDRSSKISMFNKNEKIKINYIKDGIN